MKKFKGVYTALITPFTDEDHLDEEGLRLLLQRQTQANVDGIVVLGTTGEAPTLTVKEKERIISIAKKECSNKTSFIIGTGSYSTKKTVEDTIAAEEAGADAALIVTPYYNKPTQEGLYRHFKEITDATKLPVIIYNIAGRTGQNMQTETLKRLLDIPSIMGIKEGSGNIFQMGDVIGLAKKMRPDFSVLSSDDALALPVMSLGGDGVISVISNIVPEEVKRLVDAASAGNYNLAQEIHHSLLPLMDAAFIETNPIPVKAMHQQLDLPGGCCRLPLCAMSDANTAKLQAVMEGYFSIAH